jgi:hypothetical protein
MDTVGVSLFTDGLYRVHPRGSEYLVDILYPENGDILFSQLRKIGVTRPNHFDITVSPINNLSYNLKIMFTDGLFIMDNLLNRLI